MLENAKDTVSEPTLYVFLKSSRLGESSCTFLVEFCAVVSAELVSARGVQESSRFGSCANVDCAFNIHLLRFGRSKTKCSEGKCSLLVTLQIAVQCRSFDKIVQATVANDIVHGRSFSAL